MLSSHWTEKTGIISLALAVFAATILIVVFLGRVRDASQSARIQFPFWSSLIVLALYAGSIFNIIFVRSPLFMVGWPVLGIVLTGSGLAWAFSVFAEERRKLVLSNILLLIVAILSMVAPN